MNYSFYTFYQKEILFGFFQMFIINKYTHVIPVYFNDVVINFKGGGGVEENSFGIKEKVRSTRFGNVK